MLSPPTVPAAVPEPAGPTAAAPVDPAVEEEARRNGGHVKRPFKATAAVRTSFQDELAARLMRVAPRTPVEPETREEEEEDKGNDDDWE